MDWLWFAACISERLSSDGTGPLFWTTELWLLSGALWFLGETRIEVVDLAVIQRKCAKCYQNWINRWQLRLMKGIEQEKGSFQVTHEWNFKLYAICWIWVSILHLLCCDIVANYLVLVDHCITVLYMQFIPCDRIEHTNKWQKYKEYIFILLVWEVYLLWH